MWFVRTCSVTSVQAWYHRILQQQGYLRNGKKEIMIYLPLQLDPWRLNQVFPGTLKCKGINHVFPSSNMRFLCLFTSVRCLTKQKRTWSCLRLVSVSGIKKKEAIDLGSIRNYHIGTNLAPVDTRAKVEDFPFLMSCIPWLPGKFLHNLASSDLNNTTFSRHSQQEHFINFFLIS